MAFVGCSDTKMGMTCSRILSLSPSYMYQCTSFFSAHTAFQNTVTVVDVHILLRLGAYMWDDRLELHVGWCAKSLASPIFAMIPATISRPATDFEK
jgi:hypothetical protein